MDDNTISLMKPRGIKLIQIWTAILAVLSLGGTIVYDGLVLFAFLVGGPKGFFTQNPGIIGVVMLLMCIMIPFLFIMSIAVLWAIDQRSKWGHSVLKIQASLSLLILPIGTVIGILILKYINKPEAIEYFRNP
jgi:hypothetical protein